MYLCVNQATNSQNKNVPTTIREQSNNRDKIHVQADFLIFVLFIPEKILQHRKTIVKNSIYPSALQTTNSPIDR